MKATRPEVKGVKTWLFAKELDELGKNYDSLVTKLERIKDFISAMKDLCEAHIETGKLIDPKELLVSLDEFKTEYDGKPER